MFGCVFFVYLSTHYHELDYYFWMIESNYLNNVDRNEARVHLFDVLQMFQVTKGAMLTNLK